MLEPVGSPYIEIPRRDSNLLREQVLHAIDHVIALIDNLPARQTRFFSRPD